MNVEEKLAIIKRNLQEIVTEKELTELLKKKKSPSVYLGTAITGTPHIGYFVWVRKMTDFLRAGFTVKVLLADVHGALDNTPWELLEKRYQYYRIVIPALFEALGADTSKLQLIKGSDFQLESDYMLDVLKMSTNATIHDCKKAASEVVKMGDSPKLSGLIYPILQSLDEQYLEVDVQYGGLDQRKILMFAREQKPKLGYKPCVEIMSPLVPGLTASGKMSSSEPGSKIDLRDDEKTVAKKINKAHCPEGKVEGNGVMAFCKYVIMVEKEEAGKSLLIERLEKFGGNLEFRKYENLEKAFTNKELHPADLKKAVIREVNQLLKPIQEKLKGKEKLIKEAYPDL